MDGIVFKVRENNIVINTKIYIVVGSHKDGLKEVLAFWLGKGESLSFWMTLLIYMRNRS